MTELSFADGVVIPFCLIAGTNSSVEAVTEDDGGILSGKKNQRYD